MLLEKRNISPIIGITTHVQGAMMEDEGESGLTYAIIKQVRIELKKNLLFVI